MTIATYLSDIATYISNIEGVGDPGTEVFISTNDQVDGNMIFITPYPGLDEMLFKSNDEQFYQPNFQVMVKNKDGATALGKATAIYQALRTCHNKTIGTTHFVLIRPYCPPSYLMKTNAGYYEYYINCTTMFT